MAGELGTLPRLREEPRGHAAGHPQSPPRARTALRDGYEGLAIAPVPLDAATCPDGRWPRPARDAWDMALALGEKHGFRNAQVTVIAPTGTIGLVMDCDPGIEPDFALVKFKKLAGGGYFKIINRLVRGPCAHSAMAPAQIAEIERYALGHGTLKGAPAINHETLAAKGFDDAR